MALFWTLVGIGLLVVGAEVLVRGGSRLAATLGIPPVVIGVTVVAVGTSMPELAVGIDAAYEGAGSLAIGNVAGTNVVNLLLILGLSAALDPLSITSQTVRLDLPSMVIVAATLTAMSWDGELTTVEGVVLVAMGLVYTSAVLVSARRERREIVAEYEREFSRPSHYPAGREILTNGGLLVVGIAIIVFGAERLVDGAVELARELGVDDTVIGLTVVAVGTSAPELVTTIVGTVRKERDIAIGNIIGSSVYNIVFILGATTLASPDPLAVDDVVVHVDMIVMTAVAIVCVPVFVSGRRVTRLEGTSFVAAYLVYLGYLLAART